MWPFKPGHGLPRDWKTQLRDCDFKLARRALIEFFNFANRDAASRGEKVALRNDFADSWEAFAENPRYETAIPFVKAGGGSVFPYFKECCPGGRFAFYKSMLEGREKASMKGPDPENVRRGCEQFVEASFHDAIAAVRRLLTDFRAAGVQSTLENDDCGTMFAPEWQLAQLAWVDYLSRKLDNRKLGEALHEAVRRKVHGGLAFIHKDDPLGFSYADYFLSAGYFADGGMLGEDVSPAPGRQLMLRYYRFVEAHGIQPTVEEAKAIVAFADRYCWQLDYELLPNLERVIAEANEG